MPSFNLLDRDWIPVVYVDGSIREVPLLTAIRDASVIKRIGGNALESATLVRLILAAAHRVNTPDGEFDWADLWSDRASLLRAVAEYFEKNREFFDLYSGVRPFAQTAALPFGSSTPAVIVYDQAQGNNPVFLDHSVVSRAIPLPSSRAARSLLVTHAYGGAGTGSNNPLNGNKKDQMLAGPLCARLIAVVEGDNLEQTILLNLGSNLTPGTPGWEQPEVTGPGIETANGVADLYTRNTRAARLTPSEDGAFCIGVAVYQGRAIPGGSDGPPDPMIPRYLGHDKEFKEFRLSVERSAWQDADVLLSSTPSDMDRPIRALEQLRSLVPTIVTNKLCRLRILGVAAKAQGPVTKLWRDETLRFTTSVVGDDKRMSELRRAIRFAEDRASETHKRIYSFAARYLQSGAESKPDKDDIGRLADELSPDLQDFWSTLAPAGERIACDDFDEATWVTLLNHASETTFQKAIDRLPADARRFRAQFVHTQHKQGATA